MNLIPAVDRLAQQYNAFAASGQSAKFAGRANMLPLRSTRLAAPLANTTAFATSMAHQNAFRASLPQNAGRRLNIVG